MTTLTAFLDLAVCPVSYDAIVFIEQAAMEARKVGAERLYLCVVGEPRKKPQYDSAEAAWRLWNIVLPAANLFGARVMLAADWLQAERVASTKGWKNWPEDWRTQSLAKRRHLVGGVIRRHAAGEPIVRPRASDHARRKVAALFGQNKIVTMTVRRTAYLDERNTDGLAFGTAATEIRKHGFSVWTIRDVDAALSCGEGFGEFSLDLRMAMYELADFNIVANCGPASLLWFSDRPYVMCDAGVVEDEWKGLFVDQGLPLGANWPWALPHQTLAYGRTKAEQIIEAFEAWRSTAR